MARTNIRIGGVAAHSVTGLASLQAKLDLLPQQLVAEIQASLNDGADELVEKIQSIAPVSKLETHPGDLRASVHREPGRHDLAVRVVEDAKDAKGHGYAPHVEYGHRTANGRHVGALPHFWPSVRVAKKALRLRLSRAFSRAVKRAQS